MGSVGRQNVGELSPHISHVLPTSHQRGDNAGHFGRVTRRLLHHHHVVAHSIPETWGERGEGGGGEGGDLGATCYCIYSQ